MSIGARHFLAARPFIGATNPEPPTEEPVTELPTEAPTEPVTELPTEAPTELPTESPTEVPTEPPTEAPPAFDVVFDVVTAESLASGNNQVITGNLGGRTPKGAIFIASNVAGGLTAADMSVSVGAVDAAGNQFVFAATSDSAAASSDDGRRWLNNRCMGVLNANATTFDGAGTQASFVSFGPDSVTINYPSGIFGTGFRFAVILFAGDDVEFKAGNASLGNAPGTVSVTGLAFQPDTVLMVSNNSGTVNTHTTFMAMCIGAAVDALGGIEQRSVNWLEENGAAAGSPNMYLSDAYIHEQITSTGMSFNVSLSSFNADGFSLAVSAATGNDMYGYIALSFGGAPVALADIATPTTTGVDEITAGIAPTLALLFGTNMEAENSLVVSSSLAASLGMGAVATNEAAATHGAVVTGRIQDGADPTVTATLATLTADGVPYRTSDGTGFGSGVEVIGGSPAFTATGLELNYTAVASAAKRGWGLFVGPGGAGGGTEEPTTEPATESPTEAPTETPTEATTETPTEAGTFDDDFLLAFYSGKLEAGDTNIYDGRWSRVSTAGWFEAGQGVTGYGNDRYDVALPSAPARLLFAGRVTHRGSGNPRIVIYGGPNITLDYDEDELIIDALTGGVNAVVSVSPLSGTHHLSVKLVPSSAPFATDGELHVAIDDAVVYSQTGIYPGYSITGKVGPSCDRGRPMSLPDPLADSMPVWTDIVLTDGLGGAPFDGALLPSSLKVGTMMPNAEVSNSGFAANSGTRLAALNDNPMDAADYVTGGPTAVWRGGFPSWAGDPPLAVAVVATGYQRSGPNSMHLRLHNGGATAQSSFSWSVARYEEWAAVKILDGAEWGADLAGLEASIACNGTQSPYVTQLGVEILYQEE